MLELISLLIVVFIIALPVIFKKAPHGTVMIIDRNGHFLKKVSGRYFYFNPSTDKITTVISKEIYSKAYSEIFETADSYLLKVQYFVQYNSDDVERTLNALAENRRSIDDIISCSVYTVIKNENYNNIVKDDGSFMEEMKNKIALDVNSMFFNLKRCSISKIETIPYTNVNKKFQPHVSSSGGAIKYM